MGDGVLRGMDLRGENWNWNWEREEREGVLSIELLSREGKWFIGGKRKGE